MPFSSNSTYGTVAYSTNSFYDNSLILANDGSSLSSNTLATQSALSIPIGGYERVLGKYVIWYDSEDTNELKFKITTLAASDGSTVVASTIYTQAIASVLESTGTSNTNGQGVEVEIDIGAATTGTLLTVDFNVLSTASTKANISFQARNTTGTAAGTHLLAGSHVVWKKW